MIRGVNPDESDGGVFGTVKSTGTYTLTLTRNDYNDSDVLAAVYNTADTDMAFGGLTDGDMIYTDLPSDTVGVHAYGTIELNLVAGEVYMVILPLGTTENWPYPTGAGCLVTITVVYVA